jgi:hypothetical protein
MKSVLIISFISVALFCPCNEEEGSFSRYLNTVLTLKIFCFVQSTF